VFGIYSDFEKQLFTFQKQQPNIRINDLRGAKIFVKRKTIIALKKCCFPMQIDVSEGYKK